jgi:hypothetical protein
MPLLSQLSANGNYTIVGTFDEATFNPTSNYTKNLLYNSNWVGGTSGTNTAAGAPASWLGPSINSGSILYAPALSGIGNSCRFYGNSVRPFFSYQNNFTIAPKSIYTYTVKLEDIKVSCTYSDSFIVVGSPGPTSYSFYLNGSPVGTYDLIPVGSTGIIQCVIGWPSLTTIPINGNIFRFGFGTSGVSTGDITLANPQLEFGNTISSYSTTRSSYQPTTTTGTLAAGNFASKLDTSGNFYTPGIIDEVSSNLNSTYKKNIISYSQEFNLWNGATGNPNIQVIPNSVIAPDGTLTGTTITIPSTTPGNIFSGPDIVSKPLKSYYTFSVYVKRVNNPYVCVYFGSDLGVTQSGNNFGNEITFNFNTLTFAGTNYPTINTSYVALDNGWYRISITVQPVTDRIVTNPYTIIQFPASYFRVYLYSNQGYGAAAGTAYFWGAQLEEGTVATPYVRTGANAAQISNTVTRLDKSSNFYTTGTIDEVTGILPVTDSLVTYLDPAIPQSYPGTGTTWYDISGNNHNGTINGSPTPTVHPLGFFGLNTQQALNYQQSTPTQRLFQSVYFNNNPVVYFEGTKPWTIVVWFKLLKDPGPNSYSRIFDRDLNPDGTGRRGYNLYVTQTGGTNLNFTTERWAPKQVSVSVGFTATTLSILNTWINITVTYDGATLTMYRNGVSVSTNSTTGAAEIVQGQYTINLYGTNNLYVGHNLIYSRALSATEVLNTYNATKLRYV